MSLVYVSNLWIICLSLAGLAVVLAIGFGMVCERLDRIATALEKRR